MAYRQNHRGDREPGRGKPRADVTEIGWLLTIVKIVRNNLFHGGKYPYTPLPEPARDTQLLESSRIVLETCAQWDDKVRRYFNSDLDG